MRRKPAGIFAVRGFRFQLASPPTPPPSSPLCTGGSFGGGGVGSFKIRKWKFYGLDGTVNIIISYLQIKFREGRFLISLRLF